VLYAAEVALAILTDYRPSGAAQANARALLDRFPGAARPELTGVA
jgi:hypothetical protein